MFANLLRNFRFYGHFEGLSFFQPSHFYFYPHFFIDKRSSGLAAAATVIELLEAFELHEGRNLFLSDADFSALPIGARHCCIPLSPFGDLPLSAHLTPRFRAIKSLKKKNPVYHFVYLKPKE